MRLRRPDLPLMAMLFLVVLPACLNRLDPRVGLKQSAADLVFGIPELEDASAPADTIPGIQEVAALPGIPQRSAARPSPAVACPDAEFNTVDKEAGFSVEGMPQTGSYRWKVKGDRDFVGIGRRDLAPFQTREIRDVAKLEDTNFAYTLVQNEVGSASVKKTTFNVINESLTQPLGVYLVRIATFRQTERGLEEQRPFAPEPPVLMLPLPVTLGTAFSAQGVDPTTLQALQHQGFLRSRERYDACGRMVDGFYVDGDQTFAGEQTYTRNYDYAIATQFGAMLVFEHVESPCASLDRTQNKCVPDAEIRYDANVGQLEPTPFR